jgi:hypothetical protein
MANNSALSYLEAAVAVLEACQRHMTANEITREAIDRGLLRPQGKTPARTMSAALYVFSRAEPEGKLTRVSEPGPGRARRGSVRWRLRD